MSRIYSALVAAPSKFIGAVNTVVGISAALWPTWFSERVGKVVTTDTVQLVGGVLLAASTVYLTLLWWLKPSGIVDDRNSSVVNNLSGVTNIVGDVSNSDFIHNTYNAPQKFCKVVELTTVPPFLGGNCIIDLDGVAYLKLSPPYSISTATLTLDPVPMRYPATGSPGIEVRDTQITTGPQKSLSFDTNQNKRHTIEAGGKVFIVTLRETERLQVENVANPLKFVFAIKEV